MSCRRSCCAADDDILNRGSERSAGGSWLPPFAAAQRGSAWSSGWVDTRPQPSERRDGGGAEARGWLATPRRVAEGTVEGSATGGSSLASNGANEGCDSKSRSFAESSLAAVAVTAGREHHSNQALHNHKRRRRHGMKENRRACARVPHGFEWVGAAYSAATLPSASKAPPS